MRGGTLIGVEYVCWTVGRIGVVVGRSLNWLNRCWLSRLYDSWVNVLNSLDGWWIDQVGA